MIVKCPHCGEICESDGEVPVGQHVEGPFCAKSFSYEGDADKIDLRSVIAPGMKNAEIRSCGQCGTKIPPTASFCPRCGTPVAETPLETRQSGPDGGWIDLSDDKMASFYRWLKAIEGIVSCGFMCCIFRALYVSLSGMTIVASFIYFIAGFLLTCGISRGAQWARISPAVLAVLGIASVIVDNREAGILALAELVAFGIATMMLLLPNVSRTLKDLGRKSKPTWQVCLVFWGLIILAALFEASAPVAKGLGEYKIHKIPSGVFVFASFILFPALTFCVTRVMAIIDGVTGGVAGPVEVSSSKWRNVSCPKCGQAINVPDTDDNDLVSCPACDHEFYPFGRSHLATLAFYLGLCSCFIVPAPLALWVGIIALKDIKANRGRHGKNRAWFGVVLGGIFFPPGAILVFAIHCIKGAIRRRREKVLKLKT